MSQMKTILILLGLCSTVFSCFGQGTIQFANYVNGILLAPIFGVDRSNQFTEQHGQSSLGIPAGTTVYNSPLLQGPGYTVALYAGPKGAPANALQLVATSTFRPSSVDDLPAGLWFPSAVAVPGVASGQRVEVELRVWDNKSGALTTWEQVQGDPSAPRATSGAFSPLGILGAGLATAPGPTVDPPLILVGLTSFNIAAVPEPSSLAICALGFGAILLARRKLKA
jgi:hypothetical protein